MSSILSKTDISTGFRVIKDGSEFNRFFRSPDDKDKIIIEDGEVDETVDLMKRVVWKYINDTKQIASFLKGNSLRKTCENVWDFLYNHIQYKLDKKGLEQLRRPNRSWVERKTGIDCDCFSIFVSSILTNLKIPHSFRITKYDKDVFQHVYVIVPDGEGKNYYTIDCVLGQFNYEKPFTEKKDFSMSLKGINVAVLSGIGTDNVLDLVSGLDNIEFLGADNETQRLQTIYVHLIKTRNMIAEKPNLISRVDYPPAFLKMLDYAIENWNTPNREKALAILAKNEDALNRLNGFNGEADSSDLDGLDDDFNDLEGLSGDEIVKKLNSKKPVPVKKGFFKKIGETVKKGGKLFVRFNPITISSRGGFLMALKLDIKKMASKLKWGYATKEQASKKGITVQQWEKSKNALAKVEKMFVDKLQGKNSALKNAILKGKAGGLSGIEDDSFEGMGIIPAVALAASVPVITAALKIMVDSGIMKPEEANNIQNEVNSKVSEAEKLANDPDIQDSGTETASETTPTSTTIKSELPPDIAPKGEEGIIGLVKKKPLLFIGGAALGVWGISKLLKGKKENSEKGLKGTSEQKLKLHEKKHVRRKILSINLK
jgi:hypothetical protein